MRKVSTKTKWMIATSFSVSIALIVTLAVGMTVGSWKTNTLFAVGLITIAVAVFGATVIFRLHRNRFARKLNDSYYTQYEKISDALQNSVMSRSEIRETKQDILALMAEAQAQGRDVQDVIGTDTAEFIRRVQSSFGYRSHFLFNLLSIVQYGIFFMAAMQLLIFLEGGARISFIDVTIEPAMLIMFLLVVAVIYPVVRSGARKGKSMLPYILPLLFGVAYIGMMILLRHTAYDAQWVKTFLDGEVRMIGAWWLLAVLGAVMAAAQGVKWVLRSRSLKTL